MSELRDPVSNRHSTSYGSVTICEERPAHLTNFKRIKIYWNAKSATLKDSNFIIKFLRDLKAEYKNGKFYEVIWYYQKDGDELMEMGWDLSCLLDMRFVFKNYMRENFLNFAINDFSKYFKASN